MVRLGRAALGFACGQFCALLIAWAARGFSVNDLTDPIVFVADVLLKAPLWALWSGEGEWRVAALAALPLFGIIASQLWPSRTAAPSGELSTSGIPGAVLITVHGTFAAHPDDHGREWWQRGSAFAAAAEHALGGPAVVPFHWSGGNSEEDRREAALRLSRQLAELEQRAVPYHIIGHSHGGNVIWHALQRSLGQGPLLQLQTWTTVATPFFRWRFQTVELDLIVPLLLGFGLVWRLGPDRMKLFFNESIVQRVAKASPAGALVAYLGKAAVALLAVVALYLAVRLIVQLAGIALNSIRGARERECYEKVRSRHLAVWSISDEALNGLSGATAIPKSNVGLFPALAFPGHTLLARLFTPLLLPLLVFYNHWIAPLWNWSVRLRVRDAMHGNPYRTSFVHTVAPHPVDAATPPILTAEEEAGLEAAATHSGAQALSTLRSALGVFLAGSPLAVFGDRLSGSINFDGLIHNNYFGNPLVVERMCRHLRAPAVEGASSSTTPGVRWWLPPLWRRAVAYCLVLAAAYQVSVYLHATTLAPVTKQGRIDAIVREGDNATPPPSDGLSYSPSSPELAHARHVWTTVRCAADPRVCAPREQLPAPNDTRWKWLTTNMGDGALVPLLDYIRWSSACRPDCRARDHWMTVLDRYLRASVDSFDLERDPEGRRDAHWFRSSLERLQLVAERLGGIKKAPVLDGPEATASVPVGQLRELIVATAEQARSSQRGVVLYLLPLLDLKFSAQQQAEWDKELTPEMRLLSKLRLAEAMRCGFDKLKETSAWALRPAERLLLTADANASWWGECEPHNRLGAQVVTAALADWRLLTTPDMTARLAAVTEVLLAESRDETRDAGLTKELQEVQAQHRRDVEAALARRDVNAALNLLKRRAALGLVRRDTDAFFNDALERAYRLVDWREPPFAALADLFTNHASSSELAEEFVTRLAKMEDVPGGWEPAIYRVLQAKGHMGLRQNIFDGCDNGSREHCRRWMALVDSTSVTWGAKDLYGFSHLMSPDAAARAASHLRSYQAVEQYALADLAMSGDNDLRLRSKVMTDVAAGAIAAGALDGALTAASQVQKREHRLVALAEILATWQWAKRGGHGRGPEGRAGSGPAPTLGHAEAKLNEPD